MACAADGLPACTATVGRVCALGALQVGGPMRRRVSGRAPRLAAALSLALLGSVVPLPGSAAAAAACTFDADAKSVAIETSQDIAVSRDAAGALSVRELISPPTVLACGSPTVTTVDRVAISITGPSRTVLIDQSGGRFAPGSPTATAEEIRFEVSSDSASTYPATLTVVGTAGADAITVGYSGVNLDSDEDAVADITYSESPGHVRVEGRSGEDRLGGAGGDGTGGYGSGMVALVGGRDDDEIVGGTNNHAYAVYDDAPHGVSVDLAAGTAVARPGTAPDLVGVDAVQTASIVGSNSADILSGTTGFNYIEGLEGVDLVRGRGGSDQMSVWNNLSVVDYSDVDGPLVAEPLGHAEPGTGHRITGEASYPGGHDLLSGFGGIRGTSADDTFVMWSAGAGLGGIDGRAGSDLVSFAYMAPSFPLYVNLSRGCVGTASVDGCQRVNRVERIVGSPGPNVIVGNSAANVLVGGGGNDRIYGRGGNDTLSGGRGHDLIRPGLGRDRVYGGSGADTVDYRERTAAVRVFLNDAANDGEQGERDFVRADVENVLGGSGDDIIGGSSVRNVLKGGRGHDRLYGYGGNDALWGQLGVDRLSAGDGNDVIYASDNRRDVVLGGNGTDTGHVDPIDACSSIERRRNS